MTTKEIIRLNLDDPIQIGMANEISTGDLAVYQMNHRNVWDVSIKDSNGNVVPTSDYTVYGASGQARGILPEGDVTFEYLHAGFTDTELDYFLSELGDSTNKATLACIDILLASASKRFDYKAGLKDIKASQVFDHLKDLKVMFEEKVQADDDANGLGNVGIFVNRLAPAYTVRLDTETTDITRKNI